MRLRKASPILPLLPPRDLETGRKDMGHRTTGKVPGIGLLHGYRPEAWKDECQSNGDFPETRGNRCGKNMETQQKGLRVPGPRVCGRQSRTRRPSFRASHG